MNRGFADGNKRTAYACLELCLASNGTDIAATNDEIETFIYSHLEDGTFRKDVLERWLRSHTRQL